MKKKLTESKFTDHAWEKINLVSKADGSDDYRCTRCGCEANRPPFTERFVRKGKYKPDKWAVCTPTVEKIPVGVQGTQVKKPEEERDTTCAHCAAEFETWKQLHNHHKQEACGAMLEKGKIHRVRQFRQAVDVPKPTPAQSKARTTACVVTGFGNRTALEISRSKDAVYYVPYTSDGLDLCVMKPQDFDGTYQALPDYPTGRCAALYVGFAQSLGATQAAMDALSKLVNVTKEEMDMAQSRKSTAAPAAKNGKAHAKTNGKAANGKATNGKPRETPAGLFRELVMRGTLTDDQIYAKVKEKYGWKDDKRRSYVTWHRNDLRKRGENPPPAKG